MTVMTFDSLACVEVCAGNGVAAAVVTRQAQELPTGLDARSAHDEIVAGSTIRWFSVSGGDAPSL